MVSQMEGHRRVPEMPWETIPSPFRATEPGPEQLEQAHVPLLGEQPGRVGSDGSTHNEKHPTPVVCLRHLAMASTVCSCFSRARSPWAATELSVPGARGVSHVGVTAAPPGSALSPAFCILDTFIEILVGMHFSGAQAGWKQCIFILQIRMSLFWSRR